MRSPTIVILNIFLFIVVFAKTTYGETTISILEPIKKDKTVRTGLDVLIEDHPNYLDGKKIGLVTNHSGLTRTGLKNYTIFQKMTRIELSVIFAPEHGFRGNSDAGEIINNSIDTKTSIPILSLYGSNKKPIHKDLKNIDLILFDLQDVGVRFYTYLSTLHYVMESCAENNVELIVLDRPNPNANYIDGPVLENESRSFIGLHPVPILYGLTIG